MWWKAAEDRRGAERPPLTAASRWAAFRSPIAWLALGVLVANDHVLKGSGVLPGWVTGKLSDFAGLVVAPLVACALLGARGRGARLFGFAAVVIPFVATKTVPEATRLVEALPRTLGLNGRLWTDPWDLVALVVLPLAWQLQTAHAARQGQRATRMLERLGALGSAAACVASLGPAAGYSDLTTTIAIRNLSSNDVVVQVFRPLAPLDCSVVAPDPEAVLRSTDFSVNKCLTLPPDRALPLDLHWSREDHDETGVEGEEAPDAGARRACEAVLLRAKGLDDVVLFWNDLEETSIEEYAMLADEPRVAVVDRVGERLFIAGPSLATVFTPDFELPETPCSGQP